MRFTPSTFPSLSIIPAFMETPTTVPMVSNISMKRKVNTTTSISQLSTWSQANWQKIGLIPGTSRLNSPNFVTPIGMPMMVVMTMPMSRAPLTLSASSPPVMKKAMIASTAVGSERSPRPTRVAGLSTMMPQFLRPMKAMKRPMPALIAFFISEGIAFTMSSRTLVSVRSMKISPSMRMAVRANCQL